MPPRKRLGTIYKNGIINESRADGVLGPIYFDEIIKYCKAQDILLADISICASYKARVTKNVWSIPYSYITDSTTNNSKYKVSANMLNENVFYCIDNYSIQNGLVKVGNGYISVQDANPIIDIKYRGVVVVRIYRGNQLNLISN